MRIVCGERRAAVPAGVEIIELGRRGVAFYAAADTLAREHDLGRVLAFRHPGTLAHVFLPLGGLLVSALAARRAAETPLVRWPKALARRLSPRTRCFLARERAFFAGAGTVLASSELVAEEVRARFAGFRGRLEVTGLPVDGTRFRLAVRGERAALRGRLGWPERAPVLLWIGNDPVRKGLDAARAVLARLRAGGLDARLACAGNRSEQFAGDAPGVVALGRVEAVDELYRAADVLLAPSLEDNLSFVVLEALASGLAVVTTSRNGARSYVREPAVGRVVAAPRDIDALEAATRAMLAPSSQTPIVQEARRAAVAPCFEDQHFACVRRLLG